MDRKHKLIELLEVIAPYVEAVAGLLYIVKNMQLDENTIDFIERLINDSYRNAQSTSEREKLEHSLELIKKIRQNEPKDDQEWEDLLQTI